MKFRSNLPVRFSHASDPEVLAGTPRIGCHACSGWFALGHPDAESAQAFHSVPYCAAFDAIATPEDMVEFSKKCRHKAGIFAPDDGAEGFN